MIILDLMPKTAIDAKAKDISHALTVRGKPAKSVTKKGLFSALTAMAKDSNRIDYGNNTRRF